MYLQQIVLDLSKTFMCEFHYDYIQPKDGSATKLHHMDTNSFAHETDTEYFYNNIAKEAEARFDTRGYSQDDKRPLPIGTNHLYTYDERWTWWKNHERVCCIEG